MCEIIILGHLSHAQITRLTWESNKTKCPKNRAHSKNMALILVTYIGDILVRFMADVLRWFKKNKMWNLNFPFQYHVGDTKKNLRRLGHLEALPLVPLKMALTPF